jgi:uncharacterized protein YkwD
MRRGRVAVCVVALIAAVAASSVAARPVINSRRAVTTRETALVIAINSVRRLHLLPRLRIDRRLVRAARSHSRDMLRRQYFAHGDFGRRMTSFRIRGHRFAENLVWSSGIMSANSAVAEWLASPPHRANLLDPSLRRIGVAAPVGVFDGYAPATMITADFAGS